MSPEVAIHRLVRRLQQRNRFVGRSRENTCTLPEAHVLLELDCSPGLGISELATNLRIDQSFASRVVQGLVGRRLVSVRREQTDARKRHLTLTASGRGTLRMLDEKANANYREMSEGMSRVDEGRVVKLFASLADGFGYPSIPVRSSEPPYRAQQRRITRCLGLLGDRVFGSTLSATVWQILGEVVLSPVAPQPSDLAGLLGLAPNSLSSIITTMESRGLITRDQDQRDGRGVVIRPLEAGEHAYFEVETQAASRIAQALNDVAPEELSVGIKVFSRLLRESLCGTPPLPASYSTRRVQTETERSEVRGFVARALVRDSWEISIPAHFVTEKGECFILQGGGKLLAAFDVDRDVREIRCCGWADSVSPWLLGSWITEAITSHRDERISLWQVCQKFEPLRSYLDCREREGYL